MCIRDSKNTTQTTGDHSCDQLASKKGKEEKQETCGDDHKAKRTNRKEGKLSRSHILSPSLMRETLRELFSVEKMCFK